MICYHGTEFCNICRYLPEWEVAKIRDALKSYDGVEFGAWDRAEVDRICALLRRDERARVAFSWYTWPNVQ